MEHQNEPSTPAQPGQIVFLGHQGENLARRVTFDLSDLREWYPQGRFTLAAQRNGDELPYPAARTNSDGDTFVWTLTDADTARSGYGRCELRCYDGDTLAKSEVWQTFTLPALSACGEAPEAWEDYVERMQRLGQTVQEAQSHAPRIGESGTWLLWDAEAEQYADTGLPARGERGAQGERGEPGPVPSSAWVQKSVSGGLIVIRDGAEGAPIPRLTVSIPYTPGGVIALTLTTVGKNLWDDARFADIDWAQESEGDYTGYFRGTTGRLNDGVYGDVNSGFVPGIKTYGSQRVAVSLLRGGTSGALRVSFGYADETAASSNMDADRRYQFVSAAGQELHTVRVRSTAGSTSTAQRIRELQIEVGDAPTDYEPFRGAVRTVSVPATLQPFFGGTFDAITGVWTKTLDASGAALSTPVTAQGEALACQTLGGVNTFTADCGTVELTYCADATLTDHANARKAMLAYVEAGMTATRNYTAGQLLIAGETLYRITDNIAAGGAITEGVNAASTTVAEQLAAASGGESTTVDSAFSASSVNPVQNRVIKAALDGKADRVTEVTISDTGTVTQALEPNKLYHFTGALTALTLTLTAPAAGQPAQYHFDFLSGATAPTLTLPGTVTMPDSFAVEANKRYEVDILGGYGAVMAWATS